MPKAQLLELYARALGVIEEAHIEFGEGFNVLTGETGAGKTLLVGALELCLGADATASRGALRGDSRAVALFALENGTEVHFARESSASNRLRASLNGEPSSADVLRQRAAEVIVIHGQHDSLALRSRAEVLRLVDAAGGVRVDELLDVRREMGALLGERETLGGDAASRERERDFVGFQLAELRDAQLHDVHELDDTLEELTRLSALREAQSVLLAVIDELDGDDDQVILSRWAHVIARLPRGVGVDDLREEMSNVLDTGRALVHELSVRAQPDHVDPEHLARLEARVTRLQLLVRKYGGSLEEAVLRRDEFAARLEVLAEAEERLAEIEAHLADLGTRERALAARARAQRVAAGDDLTQRIRAQLPRVALSHATLRFVVDGEDGSDVQLLFAPNPGQPEGALQSLASGGELSRVLLALSLETAHGDVVAVFDEVDAGVGGQVAQQIGECLREVATSQQVIAVTHLASVAAQAAHHFVIEKSVSSDATSTTVRRVTGEERVREIARMLAGDALSDEAHALARRLLESVG